MKCLLKNKIRFILRRAPQTNGKIEKFDIFKKKVKYFSPINEFMKWYNARNISCLYGEICSSVSASLTKIAL